MARCGCTSATECGCAASSSDCVAISGAGSVSDPFVPVLILSDDTPNGAECRDDGLFVYDTGIGEVAGQEVATSQATTSTSYVDLATVGPVAAITHASGIIEVTVGAELVAVSGSNAHMGFAISGAYVLAASDTYSLKTSITTNMSMSKVFYLSAVTVGAITVTAKYKSSGGGSVTFLNRHVIVKELRP